MTKAKSKKVDLRKELKHLYGPTCMTCAALPSQNASNLIPRRPGRFFFRPTDSSARS